MKYFTFKEMIQSDTAKSKNIDNTPNWDEIDNLKKLIEAILDPLREWYGKPIYINSGYRSEALNKAVGSTSNSQHLLGLAADIDTGKKAENKKLFDYIKDNLEFDQLIDEKDLAWVHVSYNKNHNRKQVLHL